MQCIDIASIYGADGAELVDVIRAVINFMISTISLLEQIVSINRARCSFCVKNLNIRALESGLIRLFSH